MKKILTLLGLVACSLGGFTQAKLYWVEGGNTPRIMRSDLNGLNIEVLIDSGLVQPKGIALDEEAGKMYWTDLANHKVQRANLDGSNTEDLVGWGINPYAIALDLSNDKLYWTDFSNKKIRRSDLDGNNIIIVASSPTLDSYGIAIDTINEKMYWADPVPGEVVQANLDGTNAQTYLQKIIGYFEPNFDAISIFPGSGNLCLGDANNLWRYDMILTQYHDTMQPFGYAQFLAVRSDNEIYFTEPFENKISKGTITNNYMTVELVMTVPEPHGIAIAEGTTGMKPIKKTGNIMLYPNPTTGVFNVQGATATIEVLDLFGRVVLTTNEPQIDMSNQPKGIYFVRAGEAVRKLVVR